MANKETKLIGRVLLTESEVSEGYSYLYDEYGPTIQLWSKEKQIEELSKYWISQGKKDMTEINDMIDKALHKEDE